MDAHVSDSLRTLVRVRFCQPRHRWASRTSTFLWGNLHVQRRTTALAARAVTSSPACALAWRRRCGRRVTGRRRRCTGAPSSRPPSPGQPPRNFSVLPGHLLQLPQQHHGAEVQHPQPGAQHDPGHLGRPQGRLRPAASRATARSASPPGPSTTGPSPRPWSPRRTAASSVQVVAAAQRNADNGPWAYLQKLPRHLPLRPGPPRDRRRRPASPASAAAPAAAPAARPHSKFFLFNNVGSRPPPQHRDADLDEPHHLRRPAASGTRPRSLGRPPTGRTTWAIFRQMRIGSAVSSPYRRYTYGNVDDLFFPEPRHHAPSTDPVMQTLNRVRSSGGTVAHSQSASSSTPSTTPAASGWPRSCGR